MDGWCVEWMADDFFLVGISRWVVIPRISFDRNMIIIPLVAIAIARTNPTPSHDTTAVYSIPKSVPSPSPVPLLLTNDHLPRNGSSTWAVNARPSTISRSTATSRRTRSHGSTSGK